MTTSVAISYLIFKDVRHLLECLHCCTQGPYPRDVIKTKENHLAIQTTLLNGKTSLDTLKKQYGWQFKESAKRPDGVPVLLSETVGSRWKHQDPLFYQRDKERPGLQPDDPAIAQYDPAYPGNRYLLGAKNAARAQEILKVLTDLTTLGIQAVPFPLEAVGDQSPFRYFWMITGGTLSLAALQMADRAWWGPVTQQPTEIFEEWPYHLEIPEVCLSRIDWGSDARIALLSKHRPQVLLVRRAADTGLYLPLTDLKNLQLTSDQTVEVLSAASEQAGLNFKVDLKLIDGSPRYSFKKRINELQTDISAKQELLNFLVDRGDVYGELDVSSEPLLIYGESKDAIPIELRDLLVEWADQKEEFGALRYQKVKADSWPPGLFAENQEIHIVTTAQALGERANRSVGLRLREYRRFGRYLNFDLLSEWAFTGLRLFVPHNQQLSLYPEFRPGHVAAQKLAHALLPWGDQGLRKWVAVLIPSDEGKICACQLSISDFKPLADSFQWRCAIDAPLKMPSTVKTNRTTEQVLDSIAKAFRSSVNAEAMERVQACEAELEAELQLLARELEQRQQAIASLQTEVAEHRFMLAQTNQSATTLRQNLPAVYQEVKKLRDLISSLQQQLNEIAALQKRKNKHDRKAVRLTSLINRIRDLTDRIRR